MRPHRLGRMLAGVLACALAWGCAGQSVPNGSGASGSPAPSAGNIGSSAPSASSPSATASLPIDTGFWAEGPRLPVAVSETAAVAVENRIYVAGGIAAGQGLDRFVSSNALQVLDVTTGRWSQAAAMPEGRDHLGLAALDGKLYVSGGVSRRPPRPFDNLWAYDPTSNRWSTLPPMPGPRYAHAMLAVGGRLYVVGGVAVPDTRQPEVWVYDPASDSWNVAPTQLPTWREHITAVVADEKLYVIGGRAAGNLAAVEVYDPNANSWTRVADLPTARSGLTAALVGRRIHVTGGEDIARGQTFPQHEALDVAGGTWAALPPLPRGRHGVASAAVDGRWYVIGGSPVAGGANALNEVSVFTPGP